MTTCACAAIATVPGPDPPAAAADGQGAHQCARHPAPPLARKPTLEKLQRSGVTPGGASLSLTRWSHMHKLLALCKLLTSHLLDLDTQLPLLETGRAGAELPATVLQVHARPAGRPGRHQRPAAAPGRAGPRHRRLRTGAALLLRTACSPILLFCWVLVFLRVPLHQLLSLWHAQQIVQNPLSAGCHPSCCCLRHRRRCCCCHCRSPNSLMPAQTSGELVGIVEACSRARASRFVFSRASAHQVAAAASSVGPGVPAFGFLAGRLLAQQGSPLDFTSHLHSDSRHSAAAS